MNPKNRKRYNFSGLIWVDNKTYDKLEAENPGWAKRNDRSVKKQLKQLREWIKTHK